MVNNQSRRCVSLSRTGRHATHSDQADAEPSSTGSGRRAFCISGWLPLPFVALDDLFISGTKPLHPLAKLLELKSLVAISSAERHCDDAAADQETKQDVGHGGGSGSAIQCVGLKSTDLASNAS